ncbi:MAG TPA: glycoside hydrolase domain-containing protein, partial [Planctomycetota bacterium]|nr:glycoside hydrolase domain-containing protein [Planctomycetota bacterium]
AEHWQHLDRVYALLATVGLKDIHLPLIAKTHLCNEQGMVRWIRKPDGSYDHDFSVFERYLDVAVKHLGKVPIVCLQIYDYGFRTDQRGGSPVNVRVTGLDPATGEVSDFAPPAWGTPEAREFWKPVIVKVRRILAERGLEKSMMFGMGSNNTVKAECVSDLKTLAPDVPWVNRTHYYAANVGQGRSTQPVGFTANVGPAIGVYWAPSADQPHYAWRQPSMVVHFPRQGNVYGTVFQNALAPYRIFAEGIQLSAGQRYKSHDSVHGIGHIGVDYWPVMKGPRGDARSMSGRYVFWHSLGLDQVVQSIVSPGAKGAVPSPRLQLMRESLQEAEARIFVQDALLDEDKTARLGDALAKRCRQICDERTQLFRYVSAFSGMDTREDCFRTFTRRAWETHSEKLYQAAGDVATALAKQ